MSEVEQEMNGNLNSRSGNNKPPLGPSMMEDESRDDDPEANIELPLIENKRQPTSPSKEVPAVVVGQTSFKLLLLVMMVAQNSALALVGRYSRSHGPKEDLYVITHLILVIELGKFIASCALEHYISGGNLASQLRTYVWERPVDALKISIPAGLYLFQNTLLYVALENLTAPMFQVTYQFKLVTAAIVSVIMLQRKYNLKQWVCLCIISLGVALVVLGEKKDSNKENTDDDDDEDDEPFGSTNLLVGLLAVSCACVCSALAGVYFEKVLKKKADTTDDEPPEASMWMRNIQLAFYSVLIAMVRGWWENSASGQESTLPYLYGFNAWTWTLVALQVCGGLLVAAVLKYADNVLKGLATGVSVVVSTFLSTLLFRTPLGMEFAVGACMILSSVWFFSNPLPEALRKVVGEM